MFSGKLMVTIHQGRARPEFGRIPLRHYFGLYELNDFWGDIRWRLDGEDWTIFYGLQGNAIPRKLCFVRMLVQNNPVRPVQKFLCRPFEIFSGGIEDGNVNVRTNKL
jgi:hypothetical protein